MLKTRWLAISKSVCWSLPALAIMTPQQLAGQETYTLSGSRLAVYNIAGEITVTRGSGSDLVVEVTRRGSDADMLEIEIGDICDANALRVIYPDDDIIYSDSRPHGNSDLRIRPDGSFYGHDHWHRGYSWGCRSSRGDSWRGRRGSRNRVRSRGPGVEAWADIRVMVPDGKRLEIYLVAGTVTAANIGSDLVVDVGNVEVDIRDVDGDVAVDTGSGSVYVSGVEGAVAVDTGSGAVSISSINGAYALVDTGSGAVTGSDITVSDLNVDTGSGRVNLRNVSSPEVMIDTGSGSVDLELVSEVRRLIIDTGSGHVDVSMPENTSAALEIDTGSGGIEVDFPITIRRWERDHIEGTIGDGSGRIVIDTGSGGVTLRSS